MHLQPLRKDRDVPGDDALIRDWLRWVMQTTRLKPTPLAKKAGLAPSTVLRALDEQNPVSLERRSIAKIVATLRVPSPAAFGQADFQRTDMQGFAEAEIEPFTAQSAPELDLPALMPTQGLWRIRTRALELSGYLPGDMALADSAVVPRAEDVVVGQILNTAQPGAETVLRLYDPPYLLTATLDSKARRKPALVDNTRVAIWGVVIKSWRSRAP